MSEFLKKIGSNVANTYAHHIMGVFSRRINYHVFFPFYVSYVKIKLAKKAHPPLLPSI